MTTMRNATIVLSLSYLACASSSASLVLSEMPLHHAPECGVTAPISPTPADVAIVIDGSRSTIDPTGLDLDGDGEIGEQYLGDSGSALDVGSTDPGDTYFAAQVIASRALVIGFASPDVRFSVVIFYGGGTAWTRPYPVGEIVAPLSDSPGPLETALEDILKRGPRGMTSFATGMSTALDALSTNKGHSSTERRVVLLVSDAPHPGAGPRTTETAMKPAAQRALDEGIVFNTFGLGEAESTKPPFPLSRIAGATGGKYYAVSDPSVLYCRFLEALIR